MGEEGKSAGAGIHRLRARWLAPSPPLAVDDEPQWNPLPDPADETGGESEPESPPAVRASAA